MNTMNANLVALMGVLILGLPAMAEPASVQTASLPLTGVVEKNDAVDNSGFCAPAQMTAKQLKAMQKQEKRERRAAQRQLSKEKCAGNLVETDLTAYAAQRANEAAQRSFMNASTLMIGRF